VIRGGFVESRHLGAYAIVGPGDAVIRSQGDVERPVFPRSAIKALQCLAVIESGAAERFGFTDAEIALACASHGGEPSMSRLPAPCWPSRGSTPRLWNAALIGL
jgi:L-asparaginase II